MQARLTGDEPSLVVCPLASLHISVAWLLTVDVDYDEPKDQLWARHGERWIDELGAIAAETPPFALRYEQVVATETAVIALAHPSEPVNRVRHQVHDRVGLPPQTRNTANLVHTTLCRYRGPLDDPSRLLAVVDRLRVNATTDVDELLVCEERVYPSLVAAVRARLPLRGSIAQI